MKRSCFALAAALVLHRSRRRPGRRPPSRPRRRFPSVMKSSPRRTSPRPWPGPEARASSRWASWKSTGRTCRSGRTSSTAARSRCGPRRRNTTIVFPPYFVGQIFEAKHQPGTIAYGSRMMLDFLQQTCDELARNGIKKIILVNGHGGNDAFLHFFCQSQLETRRDYVVYLFEPAYDEATEARLDKMRKTTVDGHAGEEETSVMLAHHPELVRLDRAGAESGEDQKRQAGLKHAYTGIWWYAGQPNHYRGDGSAGNAEFGKALLEAETAALVEMIRSVKKDTVTAELQKRFFDDAAKPLETKPFVKK